jgi:hypothetical protein
MITRTLIMITRTLIMITRTQTTTMRSLIMITRTLISAALGDSLPGMFHEVQHDARRQREQRHEAEAMLRHNSRRSVDWTGCAEEPPPQRTGQRRARGRHEQPGL